MAIYLYYTTLSPPSRAVLMAAKQLNVALNLKQVDLRKGEHMKPDFAKLNPTRKVPTIDDQGFVLWESRAIMQYLCNKYQPNGSLYPSDCQKRALVDRMLSFDATTYYQSVREALLLKVIRGISPTQMQTTNYRNTLELMDTLIGDNKYLTGDQLTIADLSVLASTTVLAINEYADLKDLPKLKAWYERLQKELPYFDEVNGKVPEILRQLLSAHKK